MDDRELLEMAAKAAGINLHVWGTPGEENFADMDALNYGRWNPLTEDGDALRLAGRLGFVVSTSYATGIDRVVGSGVWRHPYMTISEPPEWWIAHQDDQDAATRRAIVRAAAEIGKGMP